MPGTRALAEGHTGKGRTGAAGVGAFGDRSADLRVDRLLLALAQELDVHGFADAAQADLVVQVGGVAHGRSVDRRQHVAGLQTGLGCGRALDHFGDDRAAIGFDPETAREIGRQVLHDDAELPAPHAAVLDQLLLDVARHVDRNREPDADAATGGTDDRGVEADELTADVDQRAAGIAGVQ